MVFFLKDVNQILEVLHYQNKLLCVFFFDVTLSQNQGIQFC